ncbi:MAG: hypothetical protein MRY77_10060 [Rhodobacteraceae bacterium]|nr:hypothetical protein [Paracoccaceae bacterium]
MKHDPELIRELEAQRIAEVKARGAVPEDCGPEIPASPARGAFRVFEPMALYPDGKDGYTAKPAGHAGRKAIQSCDAFDVMEAQARKVLFTPGQRAIGRFYGTLSEKLAASGVRCSSVESMPQKSSGGGEYIDAVLRDRELLDRLQRRIGGGVALSVRRVRPSDRARRGLIGDRALVDAVCLGGLTFSEVLVRHGWVAEGARAQGKHIKSLRVALCGALDRMSGYRDLAVPS